MALSRISTACCVTLLLAPSAAFAPRHVHTLRTSGLTSNARRAAARATRRATPMAFVPMAGGLDLDAASLAVEPAAAAARALGDAMLLADEGSAATPALGEFGGSYFSLYATLGLCGDPRRASLPQRTRLRPPFHPHPPWRCLTMMSTISHSHRCHLRDRRL